MSRTTISRSVGGAIRKITDPNISLLDVSSRGQVAGSVSKPLVNLFSLRLRHLPQGLCSKRIVRKGFNLSSEQTRPMSTQTESVVPPAVTADDDTGNGMHLEAPDQRVAVRNKKITSVIREGLASLNQSSLAIQNNPVTKKGIIQPKTDEDESNPKKDAEEYRIYHVAQECLEEMCMKDPYCPLVGSDGEPIVLVGVQVKPSFSFADIFWTLPYSVMSAPELHEREVEYLHNVMEQRLAGPAGSEFKRRIGAKLSFYYAPKIRFKVAPPALRHLMVKEMETI